ncbi:ATP-binding protein, partial [Granulosicoccus sp.]
MKILNKGLHMAINGIDSEGQFTKLLHSYVSASAPIKSIEHLKGREIQSQKIERALRSPGRSVFIFGDRGVGKTSLAQTSAYRYNSSDDEPTLISVDNASTFYSVIHDLINRIAGHRPDLLKSKTKLKASAKFQNLGFDLMNEIETGKIPVPKSINEAVALVEYFFQSEDLESVVVIDEFERLKGIGEKALFADFIKQIGDQNLGLKFIFCGVASSLDELLASHHSCFRYMETVALERLGWTARAEIINAAAAAFNLRIDERLVWKISAISDGFPYYVHIVCEKLFWSIYDHKDTIGKCTEEMLELAVNEAVSSIDTTLKLTYENATRKYRDDYQEILWAAANHNNLERRNAEIAKSYKIIMSGRINPLLNRQQFNTRLNALKKDSHANILIGTRTGWYRFNENVIRGYVRLRAMQQGVELGLDRETEDTS